LMENPQKKCPELDCKITHHHNTFRSCKINHWYSDLCYLMCQGAQISQMLLGHAYRYPILLTLFH
ncbi:hypothetical protein L9G16_20660, partial [Shewanella sp. A25]|nr:hypothetical protein [Shewanella shenzhenensis]